MVTEQKLEDLLTAKVKESIELSLAMGRLLAGKSPMVQGAALADCLSKFIAGHYLSGDEAMLSMLDMHVKMVKHFLPMQVANLKASRLDG